MLSRRQELWVSAVAGFLLLALVVFYPIGQVVPKYTYEAEEFTLENPEQLSTEAYVEQVNALKRHAEHSADIQHCHWKRSRSCLVEHRVLAAGGSLVLNESDETGWYAEDQDSNGFYLPPQTPEFVYLEVEHRYLGEFYRANTTLSANGTVVLTLEPVAPMTVVDETAVSVNKSPGFEQLLETGRHESLEPLGEYKWWAWSHPVLIEHEGNYYHPDGFQTNTDYGKLLQLMLLVTGVALLLNAGQHMPRE
ncbi:hypothetical protein [Haladaptatus sp. DYSN1]|uniref:hypothetical protein n=1 Tax=unclassified Haladaptatus TaxID=2622732 RepID=UPI0024072059|nr:hypothetical protein [Haladaptatus sp. DYSN1]